MKKIQADNFKNKNPRYPNFKYLWLGLILLFAGQASCSHFFPKPLPEKEPVGFQLVPHEEWPSLEDDLDKKGLEEAVTRSLNYLRGRPEEKKISFGRGELSGREMAEGLTLFLEVLQKTPDLRSLQEELKLHFDLYRPVEDKRPLPLLITGYYEPSLRGSRKPSGRFRHPLYRLPDDLLFIDPGKFSGTYRGRKWVGRIEGQEVVPYYTRREIDQEGRLEGKNLEIIWVDDPLKLFFLHIQGSGEVFLEDGTRIKVGYRGANGHPYFAVGRELIRKGVLKPEEISLQTIYAYLKDHPEEQETILNLNPSYVFFQEVRGGPYGSLGLPLTPGRSAAMDRGFFPAGGLCWLTGWKPVLNGQGGIKSWTPLSRWVLIQDSGGAIKGPSRLDLFWGNGQEAETAAGHLRHQGAVFILLKKK